MSYCRFSSDNWKSDIYCYEDVMGGWTVHVAARRVVGDVPQLYHDMKDQKEWINSYREQHDWLKEAKREPIGLGCDGDTYNLPTIQETLDKLYALRDYGYNVPEHALEQLKLELAEAVK